MSFMEMRSLCLHEVHDLPRSQTRIVSGWCIGLGLLQGSRGAMGVCWEWAVAALLLPYKADLLLLKGWFILNFLPGCYWFTILCFLGPLVNGSQWGLSPTGTSLPLSLV